MSSWIRGERRALSSSFTG
jgi:hypothetical protein